MEDLLTWQYKFEYCVYSKKLINKLLLINKRISDKININEIQKAIYYTKKYHGSQNRESGEPYYSHPIEVAFMVADYCVKTNILVTSILHDTIEDTSLSKEKIEYIFGSVIANQVEDLTRIKADKKINAFEIIELLLQQQKKELLIIKFFDRIHNIQTIKSKSLEKQKKTIRESLKYFLPIIAKLELFEVEKLMSNYCIKMNTNEYIPDQCFSFLLSNIQNSILGGYQKSFLAFQNEIDQMYIQK